MYNLGGVLLMKLLFWVMFWLDFVLLTRETPSKLAC